VVVSKEEATLLGRAAGEGIARSSAEKARAHWLVSFEEFRKGLEPYTLEAVAPLAKGDPDEPLETFAAKLRTLADLYCDRSRKVVSYWAMGFNQHTRGTWVNEQAYMLHLLTGRQASRAVRAASRLRTSRRARRRARRARGVPQFIETCEPLDPAALLPERGYAYVLPRAFEIPGDNSADPRQSTLRLFEDGVELGPPHARTPTIRALGGGRFSHRGK
jgi:hypothetical protein